MRVTRGTTETSPAVVEICVDDIWITLNYSLPATEQPIAQPPRNLQLNLLADELFLSWETPFTNVAVMDYSAVCSTDIQLGNGRPITSLTLSLTTGDTSALIPPFMGLQESTTYSCCVTAHYETLGVSSTPTCGSVQFLPTPAPAGISDSILVPVLGVLAGVFLLALVVVSAALVVFMCTGTKQRSGALDLADQPDLEMKE